MRTLERTRHDLAAFLRAHRERVSPADVGLPSGGRRRTPGLRREEVAALAGVGLTWYTWLEQGRDIGVSAAFLDSLARVLKLDAAERRHLYLLAHERPPVEPGKTWCVVPPLVRRLMHDLAPHSAYILNLRWDVLAFNEPANQFFGFDAHPSERRNLLWLLFTDPLLHERFVGWEKQAPQMLSSFRRDFARATQEADIHELVDELEQVSPDFKMWWRQHDVHAPCSGVRQLMIEGKPEAFEHTSLTIDEDRHLRLVVYAQQSQERI
ncbi:helix-turn-helix transcriptional regulator [Pectobacterium atrosepticum]|uniref:helix-turn-helix transcriptional regulator n=1 Tax=Pectobacterium atrosepticum TaxID=29471 RepID=UPI0003A927E2|nr:helix-turn-helix transcriptional regulator [Pectobacterium atrosepticum]GKV84093.1 XRE family transcriptional regulator [Pectobacterium carotovorum subsp. carotovorum]AIA70653.1 XRE family transcriptional regulator [Pectobacterium atrosepticum]AIK14581.1 helix-turn-helix domain protein [Pectobacterium atrosepticum]ATY91327.1 XRE family transcriptional regulator [Pectobacterium atrosepticum]KFX17738.1 XRE family transcriptional regulator [Pectobacterium atrosepticum]